MAVKKAKKSKAAKTGRRCGNCKRLNTGHNARTCGR